MQLTSCVVQFYVDVDVDVDFDSAALACRQVGTFRPEPNDAISTGRGLRLIQTVSASANSVISVKRLSNWLDATNHLLKHFVGYSKHRVLSVTAQSQRPANGGDDNQYNHCPVCDGVDSQHIIRRDKSIHHRQTFSLKHVISFKNTINILGNGPLFTLCTSCHTDLARSGRS